MDLALALAALTTLAVLARLVRLRGVRFGGLHVGSLRFSFASKRPRVALPSADPAQLPAHSGKGSRPRAKRRAAKSRARTN
jgi:hypothetical protein